MSDEGRHHEVLDSLLDMQAKLRGDDLTRRLDSVSKEEAASAGTSGERILRVAPENVAVRRGDVEVRSNHPPTDAERLAALSERLERVERELNQAMDRLRVAEATFVRGEGGPVAEPEEPNPALTVYRRVTELQDLAASREPRRRR